MERSEMINQLLRIKPEQMQEHELNLALALLLKLDVRVNGQSVILNGFEEIEWAPMSNWEQFGQVLETQPIVVSSHQQYDTNDEPTRCYFRVHAYFSGLEAEGWDYRKAVAQSCVKLLEHNEKYHS